MAGPPGGPPRPGMPPGVFTATWQLETMQAGANGDGSEQHL